MQCSLTHPELCFNDTMHISPYKFNRFIILPFDYMCLHNYPNFGQCVYPDIDACKTGNEKTVISHKVKSGLSHQINATVLILYKKSNIKFLLFQLVLYIFYNLILRHSIKIIKKNITPFLYCRCYTICGIFHKDKYSIITVKNLINPFCKIL